MLDTSKIRVTSVADVDTKDYPDFCDAYIEEAEWEDGTSLTDDELEELNEDGEFVYEAIMNWLY